VKRPFIPISEAVSTLFWKFDDASALLELHASVNSARQRSITYIGDLLPELPSRENTTAWVEAWDAPWARAPTWVLASVAAWRSQ
jgi:hypothetical protein